MNKITLLCVTVSTFILFYFACFFACPLYELYGVTTQGMVGYWQLDGNADDAGGYGHNGTLHNGPVYTAGKINRCLDFDGFDGGPKYVTVDNSDTRLTITHAITIEAWIKNDNLGNGFGYIFGKTDSYTLSVYNGKMAARGPNGWWKPNGTGLQPNRWYHVAWTYDGAYQKIYIDGKEKAAEAASGPLPDGGIIYIGGRVNGFDGLIDEIKVYDRALTAAEINSSYYEGGTLTGYWPLDGNVKDYSGFNQNGTTYAEINYEGAVVSIGLRVPGHGNDVPLTNGSGALTASTALTRSKEVTMEAWIMGDAFGTGYCHIYENRGSHSLSVYNGKLAMTFGGRWWIPETTALEPGHWYLVTGTYDGKWKKLYINGKESAREPQTGNMPPGTGGRGVRIGHDSQGFNGIIDEVKVYMNALPADVIEQNYLDIPKPVGIWSFDDNARDKSGCGHHGKPVNGPRYREGKINRCLYFDGNNDYVLISNNEHRLNLWGNITQEAWIKGAAFKNDYQHIYDKYRSHTLSVKDGKLAVGGRGGWWYPPGTTLTPGQWFHVVCTYDHNEIRLYINGVLMDCISDTNIPSIGDAVYISNPYFPFHGLIDEMKIYNCTLSARDVLIRYNPKFIP